ncbi:uncharacterized protein HaLaN_02012 [Haematococcus lacustris]|uniref:Uncharacterized protein n=1 Tax=Haematococcus lacustris TaxID=44745 RepID=A0A699YJS5_HAELA|nr:uncharacterized protein HaLaN_02012 [Haematococcus lacustris]
MAPAYCSREYGVTHSDSQWHQEKPSSRSESQNGVGVMLCTDGWRHKHAALGQPLVNLVLLKPSGGAIFHNVYTLDLGLSKTKQFYVDLHNRMANEVTKGHPEQLLGVIMDGPSVNRAALNDLAFQHPTWICMTCCVHSMNLICKDLSNESSTASKHTPVGESEPTIIIWAYPSSDATPYSDRPQPRSSPQQVAATMSMCE